MSALNCFGSKENGRENLASPTDQPAEQRVLPPFSGKLTVDEDLQFSKESFKQTIDEFLNDKFITAISQLTAKPPFPTPYVLAQFASKAYTDYKTGENDAQYEARLALPDGWKLLTTASRNNGYFGTAYWHPEHQQVVIAHRGTELKNIGAIFSDISGVLFKHHVPQMGSASTFAYKVVEVLREVNHEKGTNFQVFFTGHSLGGWLAQITTFTTEYLKTEGNTFLKSDNVAHSFHPHTVVFDNPGCKEMLSQMADTFDVRCDVRSIYLEHLDITSYLSAPNRINTCNAHLGTVYRVFTDLSDVDWQEQHTALYKFSAHSMGKLVDVFNPKTGQLHKDEQGQLKVQVAIDWPVSTGLYCSEEYKHFFKWAKDLNNYHSETRDVSYLPNGCYPIRYQTKNYDEHVTSINILSQEERQFLEDYRRLCQLPEIFKPKEIFTAIGNEQAQKQAEEILQGFKIKNETIRCTDASALQTLIPYVKRLLQLFPGIKENTKCALSKIAQNVLPPFSGKLPVDEDLQFSNETFKKKIDEFLNVKVVTAISQLTATPPFPTPYVLAQFASKAYTDYNRQETDDQYETRLALPDGWKLLTTASNTGRNNGYFGAAYWHPEHQHVVIAHRGTKFGTLGAIFSDICGVLFKHHVPQMCSASTFAYNVVEVLRDVNHKKRTNFQVFFTGHSLGGWLAQITTFTTEYLKTEGNIFLKCDNVPHSYHPHTVVFDSPGCKDMLTQMADTLDVLYDGRSIDLEHLDITSYLSAPNRINTCNKHLGTVYRVFTDLSDMPWWKKCSALYNFPAHSMCRIVQVFDPESGQVLKDENGQFKLQVVRDWPLSAGLSRGKEYKSFFEWAKDLNNYHAEIENISYRQNGYHPIRYQTKEYDEHVTSISILSQEERQFLEDYRRLCQLPEFFKPKNMFTAIGNEKVQKQAEIILPSFEIENKTIRCTDASELQAHIPYVKRLLQLFPDIKEKTKYALSPHQISNNVYQIGTKRYLEKLHQSPLDFKPDALSLRDFLNSDEQKALHLRMVDGDAWTGLIKVYQVLQKTPCMTDFQGEGHYTVLTLQNLLLVNPMVNLNTLIESTTTPHLLMMACETDQLSNDETKQIFESLFNTLKHQPSVKIVLTTQSRDVFRILKDEAQKTLSNGFVTRDEQLTWSDLTPSSQEQLLVKAINFQGSEIALNQLISPNSPVTNLLPLADLLGRNHIKIGKEPVAHSKCDSYYERYYIERIFHHKVIIKQDVLTDSRKQKFPDLLASTEQEFKQLCQQNRTSNVHWLERDKSGKLVWQQSQGSLETLRKYIDTHISHTYTADDLDKLLEQAQKHRLMLISDTAGMGKSTVLTHLSKQIKQKFPAKWVVRIDLNDHTDALKTLKKEQIDKEKAIEFVSEKILKLETGLEAELFKQCCEQKQKVDIVIMLDGFDEISPSYKQTVIALLQAVRQTAVEQLWVTTRPHLRQELEDELQQLSYTLEPLSEENQVEFLTKFWSLNYWFTEMDSKEKEEKKEKLEIYAIHLIKILAQSISDKDKEFTGIPLQCRMLAEAFNEEVKTFCLSAATVLQLPFSLDLIWLYERFIENKYNIYLHDLFSMEMLQVRESKRAKERKEHLLQNMRQGHQLLALKMLIKEEEVTLLQSNTQCILSDEEITMIGIVQVSDDGKVHFIHRTFAEYYVAEFLVNRLTKQSNTSQQVQDLLLMKIFLKEDYIVIRSFVDRLLSRSEPPKEVLKQYGNRISDLWGYGVLTLHQSAIEGNAYIIGFLLESLQAGGHTDILRKLLLGEDFHVNSAWHVAAKGRQPQVLHKLWEWSKETLTTEELSNKLLLVKDNLGQTAWHYASQSYNAEALQKLWECSKEILTADELSNKLLLAKDNLGQTAWHYASQSYNAEALQKLWECSKEPLIAEELSNILLLDKDNLGQTAWHYASQSYNAEALQKLWECGKQTLTHEELINNLLLAKDNNEQTAWHCASRWGNVQVLHKLWEWGKEILTAEELSNNLLFAKDKWRQTAWHLTSREGNIITLEKMWEWGKETLTADELSNNLLLAKDNDEQTAWHLAAREGKTTTLEKMWEWGKETLTAEELSNKILLAKDKWGQTAWHYASQSHNAEALEKLWEWGKETLTAEELNTEFLLAKVKEEQTAWHLAAGEGNKEILEKLWEWGKVTLTAEEVNNKLLLAKDKEEQTAWHLAAGKGNIKILEKLWECGKETLTAEELSNKLLLAKDKWGQTAWLKASQSYNAEDLQKLWEWGKLTLTAEDLNTELLLAKDKEEQTAWHLAAREGNIKILEKLWEWGKENLTAEELSNKLLLAKDKLGQTAWLKASQSYNAEALQILWEWGKETLTAEELNIELLLAKDYDERTAWHLAAKKGNLEIIQDLWKWAVEKLTAEELNNNLLLAKDREEKTAWHVAAEYEELEVLQKLWEWGKETLTTEELSNNLLLAKDNMEQTAWHLAAKAANTAVLEKLCDWAKEVKINVKHELCLAKNNEGKTVLVLVQENGLITEPEKKRTVELIKNCL